MYHLKTSLHDIAIDLLHIAEEHLVANSKLPTIAHFIKSNGSLSGLRLDSPGELHDLRSQVTQHVATADAIATFIVSVGALPSPIGSRSALVGCLDSLSDQISLIRYFEMQKDGSVALGELVDSTVHPGSLLSSWSWLKIFNNYRHFNSMPCSNSVN